MTDSVSKQSAEKTVMDRFEVRCIDGPARLGGGRARTWSKVTLMIFMAKFSPVIFERTRLTTANPPVPSVSSTSYLSRVAGLALYRASWWTPPLGYRRASCAWSCPPPCRRPPGRTRCIPWSTREPPIVSRAMRRRYCRGGRRDREFHARRDMFAVELLRQSGTFFFVSTSSGCERTDSVTVMIRLDVGQNTLFRVRSLRSAVVVTRP